jgi:hypothetical protein
MNAQHRVEHSLQFPGVSYADASAIDHDHDHEHEQAEPAHESDGLVIDVADQDGEPGPINHHHHSGGDIQLALTAPLHPLNARLSGSMLVQPLPAALPPGLALDGPTHPPRQLRA